MPQFTNADREMLNAETSLWNAIEILDRLDAGEWTHRIRDARERLIVIVRQLREYNDQFEEAE